MSIRYRLVGLVKLKIKKREEVRGQWNAELFDRLEGSGDYMVLNGGR